MLKREIERIKERNKRVELDKAWERSWTRRILIAVITYLVILAFLYSIGAPYPSLSALVPMAGFILSTLTIPVFKRW